MPPNPLFLSALNPIYAGREVLPPDADDFLLQTGDFFVAVATSVTMPCPRHGIPRHGG